MGGIPSTSLQTSATSGNKVQASVGPVGFGNITFGGTASAGSQAGAVSASSGTNWTWIIIGGIAAVAAFFFFRK